MPILKPIRGIKLNRSHPLARGLVGCWLFNEGTGNKVFDLTGYGNTGTFTNNTHWASCKVGAAIALDGVDDDINFGASSVLKSTSLTVVVAFELGSIIDNHGAVVANVASSLGYEIMVQKSDGMLWWAHSRAWTINYTGYYLNVGDYCTAALCFNESSGTVVYANGIQVDTGSETGALTYDAGSQLAVGRRLDTANFDFAGKVDYVFVYNRALSAAEIAHLYREPFCMFDLQIKPGLLYPAGQIIWLTAASTAASSVDGTLTKHSKLAGIIDAAAALSGILTWLYRGPAERQWLTESLFNGMTANAFKLVTVLTGGWFWMRRSGCCALYRGPSMEWINFANILTVAEQDAGSISPPSYLPHHSNSTYFYVVRRFNICGYQERTLAAAVKVAIDADGNLIKPKPNNIFVWRLNQVYGNKIQLIWFYCPLEQESKPESFRIYYDGGTGLIDYENPIATINYQGRKFYTYQSDTLTAGRYLFAVRAEDAAGVENNSLAQLPIQLNITNPDAIDILSVQNV